ncbi:MULTISPECIES: DsrE family protein [unclassified Thioalkalivibrio]|uniref:DsrE family protein n=1 Tax=unclassified Thioalkalivibrio TaxID=2621013 RepID=UPI0003764DFB|nr:MULTISPECIES: DsrE family protein [unclassified Thioalkalivibrio]
MKKAFILPLALTAAAMLTLPGAAMADYGEQKVVYHVNYNDMDRHMAAMGNIQNHINAVGAENMEIRVVMHGPGLHLLRNAKENEDLAARIEELKMQDVDFNICNVTVTRGNVDISEELFDATEYDLVPSGVGEIGHLQTQGFVYLRP